MLNRIFLLPIALCLMLLAACGTLSSTGTVSANANARWLLLPIDNLSSTPQAGEKAQSLLELQLRKRGVSQLESYTQQEELSLVAFLDVQGQIRKAAEWGHANGHRYGLTGTIHEWHYKTGPDKEPAVGVSLKLIDLYSNDVLWQGTAAKTGWGYANISAVADSTIKKLMDQVKLTLVNAQ